MLSLLIYFVINFVNAVDYFVIETEDSSEPEILLDRTYTRGANAEEEEIVVTPTTYSKGVKEFGADYGGYAPQGYLTPVCKIILDSVF